MYDYVFLISLYRFILLLLNKSWHDCSSLLDFLYKNSAEIIQNGHMHFHYFLHIDISCASANNFYTAWLNCNLYLNIILWWWFFVKLFFSAGKPESLVCISWRNKWMLFSPWKDVGRLPPCGQRRSVQLCATVQREFLFLFLLCKYIFISGPALINQ